MRGYCTLATAFISLYGLKQLLQISSIIFLHFHGRSNKNVCDIFIAVEEHFVRSSAYVRKEKRDYFEIAFPA